MLLDDGPYSDFLRNLRGTLIDGPCSLRVYRRKSDKQLVVIFGEIHHPAKFGVVAVRAIGNVRGRAAYTRRIDDGGAQGFCDVCLNSSLIQNLVPRVQVFDGHQQEGERRREIVGL